MKKVVDFLTNIESFLAGSFICFLTIFVVFDIGAREIFEKGLPWAQKSAVYLMIWAGFLGAILVSHKASHLRPEIADKLWSKFPRAFVRVQNFITLALLLFFFSYAFNYVKETQSFGDKSVILGVKLWILQLIIPYTLLSMSLRHLFFIIYPDEQLSLKKEIV